MDLYCSTKASGIDSDPTFYVDDDSETPTATYTGGKGRDAGVGLSISRKIFMEKLTKLATGQEH